MKINVSEIPPQGLEIQVSGEGRLTTVKAVSPYQLSIKIVKSGSEVFINGEGRCNVELQCSRCLNDFEYNIYSPLDIVFHPASELNKEGCHELQKEELDIVFYSNNLLDIDDIANEQLALNIPMKPLCSAECKGICPECGADLNTMQCNCKGSNVDERLKVLEKLIKREE